MCKYSQKYRNGAPGALNCRPFLNALSYEIKIKRRTGMSEARMGGGCRQGVDMTGARSACENSASIVLLSE